jgi:PhoPQ-activated pathogenicity-related protein
MKSEFSRLALGAAFLVVILLVSTGVAAVPLRTTSFPLTYLDEYVARDDGCFNFEDLNITRGGNGWTGHVWNLTSQCWLDGTVSNRPIWWHTLVVVVPHFLNRSSTAGLLYITGGDNNNDNWIPSDDSEDLVITAELAISTRNVAAVLFQVPNQPITFPWDPWHAGGRSEDAAIAITWWHFVQVNTSQPEYVLELPMTKAAVKALDALETIIPIYTGTPTTDFYVAGASKRGWTTWLVGAVSAASNGRVKGIIPIVLDALNLVAFAHRQFQFYGAWTFALVDYYNVNFTGYFDLPQTKLLMELVDPWYYRERLTMPKLAINAGGDEFQMPDDHRYWAHDMVGEMNLLMVKNAEHSMATGVVEVLQGAGSFVQAMLANSPRPQYTWAIDNATGMITMTTNVRPKLVTVASSSSGEGVSTGRRDFRWAALNVSFCPIKIFGACIRPLLWTTSNNVTMVNEYTYTALLDTPSEGWVAFFIEMQWDNPTGPDDFYFTSATSVLPNTMPFPDCHGEECHGSMC